MNSWRNARIERRINPLTELIEGDDAGYRNMRTLQQNRSPLVVPDVLIRPSYDGIDEFGSIQERLPGGLTDGRLVVRETVARALEYLDQLVYEASDGEFQIAVLDGFRSQQRQAAGFTRLLREQMSALGVSEANHIQKLPDFMQASRIADGTFSWVRLAETPELDAARKRLHEDGSFTAMLSQWLIRALGVQDLRDLRPADYIEGINEYLIVSANAGIGHGAGLRLNSECNAHAGGGAVDVFVIDRATRKPMNIVYFDYPGPEAGMDFMEGEGAYEQYLQLIATNRRIMIHAKRLVGSFTSHEWERIRGAIRILYHASKGAGFTYYSSDHGGENWHLEPGNIVYEPSNGNVVTFEKLTAHRYPDSGNPGHTLQTHGKSGLAVWGGATAHALARQHHGLS